MKYLFILTLLFNSTLWAQYQKPYIKKNGKIVSGHLKTKPNKTKADNYSTKGNVNPYNLKKGGKK